MIAMRERWHGLWTPVLMVACLCFLSSSMGCTEKSSSEDPPESAQGEAEQAAEAEPNEPDPMEQTTHVPSPDPPDKMRYITVTDAKIEEGQELYGRCVGCHGAKAEGKVGTAPRLNSRTFLEAASDTYLVETIMKGRPGTTMIPWGNQLETKQAEAIVAYIRSMQPTEAADLDRSELAGDPKAGEQTFQICARCHGDHGGGYQESAPGTGIARKGFLSTATNGFLRYVIFEGKSQTPMRSFHEDAPKAVADLSEEQVENVIAYMRHNAW